MSATNATVAGVTSLNEAVALLRWIGERNLFILMLRGNRLTPPPFSEVELVKQTDMWGGLINEIDDDVADITLKAQNILAYMVRYQALHTHMETIMDYMQYRHIKHYIRFVSICSCNV